MRHGGLIEAARGHLGEAERRLREAMAACDAADLPEGAVYFAIDVATVRIEGGADPRTELRRMDAEAERRMDAIAPPDRAYAELGTAWADYGRDADRAEAWWKELDEATPDPVREGTTFALAELDRRHWLALLRGRPEESLRVLRAKQARQPCRLCDAQGFAETFIALEQPDSAIAALEPLVERPDFDFIQVAAADAWRLLPLLAGLYEQVGRVDDARATWQRVAELWSDADRPFRKRAEEASAHAASLAQDGTAGSGGP